MSRPAGYDELAVRNQQDPAFVAWTFVVGDFILGPFIRTACCRSVFGTINIRSTRVGKSTLAFGDNQPNGNARSFSDLDHEEEHAVTGSRPEQQNVILFGADIYAPLNNWMAIHGETDLMTPADSGAVDAFLGIEFRSGGLAMIRDSGYSAFLPVAASMPFTNNLRR